MKRNVIVAIAWALTFTSIAPAKAQVVLDLSLITCKQLLDSDPDRQALIGSWMSGYFSASKNISTLDFRYVKRKPNGRWQLLQDAQVGYGNERNAEELALKPTPALPPFRV